MGTPPKPLYSGMVRDIYTLDDPELWLIVNSDRISIFNIVMRQTVPGRGRILTALTDFWLNESLIATIAPNHLVPVDSPEELPEWTQNIHERVIVVRIAAMQPVEWIVRSHLAGPAWREYHDHGTIHGNPMPTGMVECSELPEPTIVPSTKVTRGTRNTNITFDDAVQLLGGAGAEEARRMCLEAYQIAAVHSRQRGVILLDTKFELGYIDGNLAFCGEVLTPNSSRFVLAEDFQPGHPPKTNDKEHLQQWAHCIGWTGNGRPPHIDGYLIRDLVHIYRTMYERLTR